MHYSERVLTSLDGQSHRPLTDRIHVRANAKSKPLQRAMVDFGAEHSFAESCTRIKEHYGFDLNASAVREATLQHAKRAQAGLEVAYEGGFRALPRKGAEQLIAEADGCSICIVPDGLPRKHPHEREWRELRVAVVEVHQQDNAPHRDTKRVYAATFGPVDAIGHRWGHCAKDAGWGLNTRIHVLADGAPWICDIARETFGKQGTFLLDFFHACEYLAPASNVCNPLDPTAWFARQKALLKKSESSQIIEALAPHKEADSVDDDHAPVRAAWRYLSNRTDQLDYANALAQKLPIGSGLIESSHRSLIQKRLKLPGAAWCYANAEAIVQLRVCRANDQWDDLWNQKAA